MKKRYWASIFLLLSGLFCSTLWLGYNGYRQLFPQLEQHSDTQLLDQYFIPQVNLRACRISLIQRQHLVTTQTRNTIWSRLPTYWDDGTGEITVFFDQTLYQQENQIGRVRSWVHYSSTVPADKPLFITNSLTLKLC